MKKLLLLFGFVTFSLSYANAQLQYEMDFSKSFISDHGNTSPTYVDTVCLGDEIHFNCVAENNGTKTGNDDFPGSSVEGSYTMNWHASTKTHDWPATGRPSVNGSIAMNFPKISFLGFGSSSGNTIAVSSSNFTPNAMNIIIIWPNDGKGSKSTSKDSFDNSQYTMCGILNVWVKDCSVGGSSGIQNTNPKNFRIYPNPVKDVLNVQLNNGGKGTIKLTDITGKEVATQAFETTNGGQVTINLNKGNMIPEGAYFVTVQTANYSEVTKILISK